jgi:hypothetical protein
MMEMEEERVEELARKIAANGATYLPLYQAALERAREILATGEIDKIETWGSPLYWWEYGEPDHPPDVASQLFTASVESTATGGGMSVDFAAGLARGEVEFRRSLALKLGPHKANGAMLKIGSAELAPFSAMFVSPTLQATLKTAEDGGMPAFGYFAHFSASYS